MTNKLTKELEAEIRSNVNPQYKDRIGTESYERDALLQEIDILRSAIWQTLDDNRHLADGNDCTLIEIKNAVHTA